MGQFANTVFSGLLGWVQTAASWLWSLATNTDVSAWLAWLLDNWLPLVILLCLAGVLVDFVVYLIRWQPYRVWGRFLRRLKGQNEPAEDSADALPQPVFQRRWVYADGSTAVEDVRDHQHEVPQQPDSDGLEAPIRPVRRMARRATLEQSYNQPVYPPQWQHNIREQQGENE